MSSASRLLFIAVLIMVALLCAGLGVWQVGRLKARRAANTSALTARLAPIVVVTGGAGDSTWLNRRVRVQGRYDHEHDVVLRGRAYRGVPGVEIVTPLLLDGDSTAVLVNRGFVPSPDATTVATDSLRESGTLSVTGIALPIGAGPGAPLRQDRQTTWARLDLEALRESLPYPIYSFYVQQVPDSLMPRFPRRLDPPVLNDGPHLFYAIQWFGFAAIAVAFGVAILRQKRER
jgi:surfeit locus 1 family protein